VLPSITISATRNSGNPTRKHAYAATSAKTLVGDTVPSTSPCRHASNAIGTYVTRTARRHRLVL